jgi:hypothetical protein
VERRKKTPSDAGSLSGYSSMSEGDATFENSSTGPVPMYSPLSSYSSFTPGLRWKTKMLRVNPTASTISTLRRYPCVRPST